MQALLIWDFELGHWTFCLQSGSQMFFIILLSKSQTISTSAKGYGGLIRLTKKPSLI